MKTYVWNTLSEQDKKNILLRPLQNESAMIRDEVKQIISQIKTHGDKKLIEFTQKYDRVLLSKLAVSEKEYQSAIHKISDDAKHAMEFAKQHIESNHIVQYPEPQRVKTDEGVYCEKQARPIERVGLYIPGGSAPLISTTLMLGVPAKIACCPVRILCTPPNAKGEIDPHLIVAAQLCGIDNIYKIGGAQAIAAMAYGTETIPKVDKIFGPGNRWVTQAKLQVSEDPQGAGIDMPAGPSELMVIADNDANPAYVAADLLSQAEHGVDSQVMLVALSPLFASKVKTEILTQVKQLPRAAIVQQALDNSRIIIVDTIDQALVISNLYAPEHLSLQLNGPDQYIANITNAGAVFMGPWAPETVGDYVTGSNHVLPTFGYARRYSGLSVTDFMKYISFQTVTRKGLEKIGGYAETLAELEGLHAHKQAISIRLREEVNIR